MLVKRLIASESWQALKVLARLHLINESTALQALESTNNAMYIYYFAKYNIISIDKLYPLIIKTNNSFYLSMFLDLVSDLSLVRGIISHIDNISDIKALILKYDSLLEKSDIYLWYVKFLVDKLSDIVWFYNVWDNVGSKETIEYLKAKEKNILQALSIDKLYDWLIFCYAGNRVSNIIDNKIIIKPLFDSDKYLFRLIKEYRFDLINLLINNGVIDLEYTNNLILSLKDLNYAYLYIVYVDNAPVEALIKKIADTHEYSFLLSLLIHFDKKYTVSKMPVYVSFINTILDIINAIDDKDYLVLIYSSIYNKLKGNYPKLDEYITYFYDKDETNLWLKNKDTFNFLLEDTKSFKL